MEKMEYFPTRGNVNIEQTNSALCMLGQEVGPYVLRVLVIDWLCCVWLHSSIWNVHADKVLADNTLHKFLLSYYFYSSVHYYGDSLSIVSA